MRSRNTNACCSVRTNTLKNTVRIENEHKGTQEESVSLYSAKWGVITRAEKYERGRGGGVKRKREETAQMATNVCTCATSAFPRHPRLETCDCTQSHLDHFTQVRKMLRPQSPRRPQPKKIKINEIITVHQNEQPSSVLKGARKDTVT